MIDSALNIISRQLNRFRRRDFDLDEDVAVVFDISERDGTLRPRVNNKLRMLSVNMDNPSNGLGQEMAQN